MAPRATTCFSTSISMLNRSKNDGTNPPIGQGDAIRAIAVTGDQLRVQIASTGSSDQVNDVLIAEVPVGARPGLYVRLGDDFARACIVTFTVLAALCAARGVGSVCLWVVVVGKKEILFVA